LIEKEFVDKFRFGQGKELSKRAFSTISICIGNENVPSKLQISPTYSINKLT